ncbi:MAG: DUF1727 domain-containing protein [Eggerthellaceae bacterium]|nr:DUF1727 domain-containing protein [Eggerthellaceae bacterium]
MGIRAGAAQAASGILTWGLRHVARRPAANLPGIVGLAIDPSLIAELRGRIREGSIAVVGTNGKTTVTNLIADAIEVTGRTVVCNRTGANLKSGVASALLHTRGADWGVMECDELWSAKVLPELRPTYMLLLNLFRDQLDRCGEIDRIQDAIVAGLAGSPETTLIYNADDPLCEMVARRAAEAPSRADSPASVPFGIQGSMNLVQNQVTDATICQVCSHMLEYEWRQYGQLGSYRCPSCGFARSPLAFIATDVDLKPHGLSMRISVPNEPNGDGAIGLSEGVQLTTHLSGTYIAYNLLAMFAACTLCGCAPDDVQRTVSQFNPKNGRLQEYAVDGRRVLLNLAKNPTGFNQNLRIVGADPGPRVAAFFINDRDVDGHDISWIWDIDFEELLAQENIQAVFAGASRKNDLQVRLKHAGVSAILVDGIENVLANASQLDGVDPHAAVYAIANYTALPPVKAALDAMPQDERDGDMVPSSMSPSVSAGASVLSAEDDVKPDASSPVTILHVLPDLLNLYGDGGNVRILADRLRWRGIPVQVRQMRYGDDPDISSADLIVLGGSPDREQRMASEELGRVRDQLAAYVEEGGPMLAICGGYQMLGRTWLLDGEEVPGMGILPMETLRPGTSADRLVDNIALASPLAKLPVIGYENHAGRTFLDEGAQPFGQVISKCGHGNNDADDESGAAQGKGADGILFQNVIGTYLHGPLLAKSPEVADWLLARALDRWSSRTGEPAPELERLDDAAEEAANAYMRKRIC